MIRIKNHKQEDLFDPWSFLSPKRRQILDQSWAGLFWEELLCELPVNELAPFLMKALEDLQKNYTQLSVRWFFSKHTT